MNRSITSYDWGSDCAVRYSASFTNHNLISVSLPDCWNWDLISILPGRPAIDTLSAFRTGDPLMRITLLFCLLIKLSQVLLATLTSVPYRSMTYDFSLPSGESAARSVISSANPQEVTVIRPVKAIQSNVKREIFIVTGGFNFILSKIFIFVETIPTSYGHFGNKKSFKTLWKFHRSRFSFV